MGRVNRECQYCGEYRECALWRETGEYVCRDCREGLLDQEFSDEMSETQRLKEEGWRMDRIRKGMI